MNTSFRLWTWKEFVWVGKTCFLSVIQMRQILSFPKVIMVLKLATSTIFDTVSVMSSFANCTFDFGWFMTTPTSVTDVWNKLKPIVQFNRGRGAWSHDVPGIKAWETFECDFVISRHGEVAVSTIAGFFFLAAVLGLPTFDFTAALPFFAATLFTGLGFDFFTGDGLLVSSISSDFLFCEWWNENNKHKCSIAGLSKSTGDQR